MKIGVDIRCLSEPNPSGVAYYTKNLLENIFLIDKENQYFLFCNSYEKENRNLFKDFEKFNNVFLKEFNYPNKLLNTSINFLHYPKIDKLLGGVDIFFAPNLQFISLSKNCKKIVTVHDLSFDIYPEFLSLKRKLWHKFINPKKFIAKADKIIAVSKNTKKDLVNLYKIKEEKIKVIHSGIKKIKATTKNTLLLPEKYILTISTIEPRKNIASLIDAFKILKKKEYFQDYKLLIAGAKGWKADDVYKKGEENNDIKFLGFVSDDEKSLLYKNTSVFVYPSFYEGFGFPPLEALNYNKPVIASHSSSLPEILGEAALYVNPYDISEIVKALEIILTDNDFKQNLIKKSEMQIKKFNWQEAANKTLQVFQGLI